MRPPQPRGVEMGVTVAAAVTAVLPAAGSADRHTPLANLGLDSIAVIRIIRRLELDCQVAIPREAITQSHFATLDSIEALVATLK